MGRRRNKSVVASCDTYIEADPVEAGEEAKKSGSELPESAVGRKLASAGFNSYLHNDNSTLQYFYVGIYSGCRR